MIQAVAANLLSKRRPPKSVIGKPWYSSSGKSKPKMKQGVLPKSRPTKGIVKGSRKRGVYY